MTAEKKEEHHDAKQSKHCRKEHRGKPKNAQCNSGTVDRDREGRDGGYGHDNNEKRTDNTGLYGKDHQ